MLTNKYLREINAKILSLQKKMNDGNDKKRYWKNGWWRRSVTRLSDKQVQMARVM